MSWRQVKQLLAAAVLVLVCAFLSDRAFARFVNYVASFELESDA